MKETMQVPPIFIVGAPRSGTTLLAAMIASHPLYACGAETHFFSKLSDSEITDALNDVAWPAKAVAALSALTLAEQKVLALYGLNKDDVSRYLMKRKPSVRAMLEAIVEPQLRQRRKKGWAEKTPNHLLHLDRIRSAYPEARIIRIMRDPRATALSMKELPWTSDSVLPNIYLWREWFLSSKAFFNNDNLSVTIRYEDLLKDGESTLRKAFDSIDIPFHSEVLNYQSGASGVTSQNEPWKSRVMSQLDASRAEAWKIELSRELIAVGSLVCAEAISEFGYPGAREPVREIHVTDCGRLFIEKQEAQLIRLAKSRVLVCSAQSDEKEAVVTSIRLPGRTKAQRLQSVSRFIRALYRAKQEGRPIRYLADITAAGVSDRLCRVALARWGESVSFDSDG